VDINHAKRLLARGGMVAVNPMKLMFWHGSAQRLRHGACGERSFL
jgi:hypothetical protein